jgi:hypothetical protein
MSKDPKNDIVSQMQQTLHELGIGDIDWKRHASAGDVLYLLDQCPFLQIMDLGLAPGAEKAPLNLVSAKSGWKIHDYGHALSSSPGDLMYGQQRKRSKTSLRDDDEGGAGSPAPGAGTLVNQSVITAWEMVELARERGWEGIHFIDGHPLMAWAAWMRAADNGMEMEGYTPTAQDISKRRRIKQSATETFSARGPSLR